jgi:WD40 repeat protein
MTDHNPYRRTFLRAYWVREWERITKKPYSRLLGVQPSSVTEEDYLNTLSLDLKVRPEGRSDGDAVELQDLIAKGARIALFDEVGAGKRTVARKVFRRMFQAPDLQFLPVWLPRPGAPPPDLPIMEPLGRRDQAAGAGLQGSPLDLDLIGLIARETGDSCGGRFTNDLVRSWLRCGPPLLLFLELDGFGFQSCILEQFSRFWDAHARFSDTCCIITCHSNLGWNRGRLLLVKHGFDFYGIQRPSPDQIHDYKHRIRSFIPSVRAEPPRRWFDEHPIRPDRLHLLCVCPQAACHGSDALLFQEVERHLLHHEYSQLPASMQDVLRDPEHYRSLVRGFLGGIAHWVLGLDPVPVDTSGFELHPWTMMRSILKSAMVENIGATKADLLHRSETGQADRSIDYLIEIVIRRSSFVVLQDETVRFVNDNFLAYFACTGFINLKSDVSIEGRSWYDRIAGQLQVWHRLSERTAEFLGGFLTREELDELLRAAVVCKPVSEEAGKSLARSILSLCQGADPDFEVPGALREGHQWHSLEVPSLLPGELHGLLRDQAARADDRSGVVLETFARDLAGALDHAKLQRPWVERIWPIPTGVGLTTSHEGRVLAVRILTDGRVVSGDARGNVLVWDRVGGGREVQELHQGPVRALDELTWDSRCWVVSAGDDRTVRLWYPDLEWGERKTQPRAHAGKVLALAVVGDPGSPCVVSAGEDGLLYAWWPWISGEAIATARGHRGSVRLLCAVPGTDPPLVASAGDDGSVRIWRVQPERFEGPVPIPPREPPHPITALASDGTDLVWGDELGWVFSVPLPTDRLGRVVLDRITRDSVSPGLEHTRAVTALLPAEDHFFSTGLDGRVLRWTWNPLQAKPERALDGATYRSVDRSLWTLGPGRSGEPRGRHPGRMRFLRVLPGKGPREFVTTEERLVRIGRLDGGTDRRGRHRGRVTALALGTNFFVSGGRDGTVMLFEGERPTAGNVQAGGDRHTGGFVLSRQWPDHHDGPVTFLRICEPVASAAGRGEVGGEALIVTAGQDGMVCVWRVARPVEHDARASLGLHAVWRGTAPVTALWASERAVIWAGKDGRIYVGDPETQKQSLLWMAKGGPEVTALSVRRAAADGSAVDLIAGTSNEEVIWGREIAVVSPQRSAGLASLKLATNGGRDAIRALGWLGRERFAVARRDCVDIVDARNPERTSLPPTNDVSALSCSPGGHRVVWGTSSGEVHTAEWSGKPHFHDPDHVVADGEPRSPRPFGRVAALQCTDENTFVWASRDGKVMLERVAATGLSILAGYPVGGQITIMDVMGPRVVVGLADGSVVALRVHRPETKVDD